MTDTTTTFVLMLDKDVFDTEECVWFRFDGLGSVSFTDSHEDATEFTDRKSVFDAMAGLKETRRNFLKGRKFYVATLENGYLSERCNFERFFSDDDIRLMAGLFRGLHQMARRHNESYSEMVDTMADHLTDDDAVAYLGIEISDDA